VNPRAASGSGACRTCATIIHVISRFFSVVVEFLATSQTILDLWKVHFRIQMIFFSFL